ncbi:helix-turn-helix domain-containing protein [Ktedonobacter robiniae]|uniref:helix-turn-helix domain-containing protein n=1 Tax=Ktedonobacter robiniae TaxID=2778365 RepID=UPI0019151B3C
MPRPRKPQPNDAHPILNLEKLLDIHGVMEYLSVSRQTVYMLIDQEGLPVVRVGAQLRFIPSSVQRWLLSRQGTA